MKQAASKIKYEKNEYAKIKVKKIKFGHKCDKTTREELTQLIRDNGYSNEIIEE